MTGLQHPLLPTLPQPRNPSMAKTSTHGDPYTVLRDMILREQVLPNERLIETDFAERLGTNRATLRKVLSRLEQDGLVVIEPFKGAHVRRITEIEAVEITEVRTVLEGLLVRRAAERATSADKAELRRLQSAARALLKKGEPVEVGGSTRLVRAALWRISGHTTAQRILTTINSQLVRIWFRAILMPGRAEEIVDHLDSVVEAVCNNQPDEAAKAMRRYHAGSMGALKRAVGMAEAGHAAQHLP